MAISMPLMRRPAAAVTWRGSDVVFDACAVMVPTEDLVEIPGAAVVTREAPAGPAGDDGSTIVLVVIG